MRKVAEMSTSLLRRPPHRKSDEYASDQITLDREHFNEISCMQITKLFKFSTRMYTKLGNMYLLSINIKLYANIVH